jgi:hypothetical protein
MIGDFKDYITVEEFILDNRFVDLVKTNNTGKINELTLLYPEKKDIINNAIVLLQYLKIEYPDISDEQIDGDWSVLLEQINRKKRIRRNRRFYLWSSVSIAAACAAVIFLIFFNPVRSNVTEKDHLYSLMESASSDVNEIQIIAGKNQTCINNNETIIQTEDGNLIVGTDKKMESSQIKTEYLTVIVPKGKRTTLKLSDGSSIWVNSGTKLVYPKVFNDENREIMIDGEAYLNVSKDEKRPFIVHTRGFDVAVLGTQFNISAYSNDRESSVVLVEGAVEIAAESSKGKLYPNQGFFSVNGSFSIKNVDVYPYICWRDGVMQLNGESLDVIMKRLSRYYGVEIKSDNRFALERYKGKVNLSESLETVLYNISLSTPLTYTKEDDVVFVK